MIKFFRLLGDAGDWIGRIAAIAIVAIMVIAVFMRYAIGAPLQWVEEVLITIFVWMIMIGAVSAMRARSHVSIDAFTCLLPTRVQAFIQVMNDVIVIVILSTLGWLGWELAAEAGEKITPILGIPYTYIDLAVPVGCAWMIIYVVVAFINDLRCALSNKREEPLK